MHRFWPGITNIDVSEKTTGKQPPEFLIVESEQDGPNRIDITADTGVCDSCLAEMLDPQNRRFGHPFINCTIAGHVIP